MPFETEASSNAFFPVAQEGNSPEAGTEGFRQEGVDQNEFISQEMQEIIEFQEFERGLEIQNEEIVVTNCVLHPIPPEKESSEALKHGFMMLGEIEQNELEEVINQYLDLEQAPTPEHSSDENKDDPLKKQNQKVELHLRKSSAPSKTGSNNIKRRDCSGKCCECNEVYPHISNHSRYKHNAKLKKCTASSHCKEYFASVQKRAEHEQREHSERKEFCCRLCHFSAEHKGALNTHVHKKHWARKIKCRQKNCGKMFPADAELKVHVKMCHEMDKCPKCGRKMSLGALKMHNRYGSRCRLGAAADDCD